jgi:hypothetical protein
VKAVEPLYVENGPVKQNVMMGDDVDLDKVSGRDGISGMAVPISARRLR